MSISVLGVDPSLSNTGLCWGSGPDDHETERVGYKVKKDVNIREIRSRMFRIEDLTAQTKYKIKEFDVSSGAYVDLCMIESYSFSSRNGGEYLGEYGGVLRSMLVSLCMEVIEVAPTAVKKFATGKGNSKKEVIIGHVQKRWNVLFDNSDEADAYVLYRIGLCYAGICEPETQAQAEVIKKLKGE